MDLEIRIAAGAEESLDSLYAWLSDEEELRGRVSAAPRPIGAQELGSLPDLLTVALGAGGAGSVLASSLRTWLQTRRTTVKITMTVAGRSLTVDLQTVDDAAPLLEQILKAGDGD